MSAMVPALARATSRAPAEPSTPTRRAPQSLIAPPPPASPWVRCDRRKERQPSGIAHFHKGLNRGGHGVLICQRQETTQQLGDTRLRDLHKQVRQLADCRASSRQTFQRAFDTEGDFFETFEGKRGQRLAGRMPCLGLIGAQNIDEQIHYAWPLHLSQHPRDPDKAHRRFVFLRYLESKRLAR